MNPPGPPERPNSALEKTTRLLQGTVEEPLTLVSARRHAVFRTGESFIKVPLDPADQYLTDREAAVWTALRPGMATLLELEDGRSALIMRSAGSHPETLDSGVGSSLASTLQRLHGVNPSIAPGVGSLDVGALQVKAMLRLQKSEADPSIVKTVEALFAHHPSSSMVVLSHGDLNMRNFVTSNAELTLIDLEGVMLAPPEWDIAFVAATSIFDQAPPEMWRTFRDAMLPFDEEVFVRCLQVIVGTSVGWASWQESMGAKEPRDSVKRRLPLANLVLTSPHALL